MKRYSWPADHSDPVNSGSEDSYREFKPFLHRNHMPIMAKTTHRPPGKKGAKKTEVKFYERKNHESDYCLT